jgi:arylsulfatase A-like enzyme
MRRIPAERSLVGLSLGIAFALVLAAAPLVVRPARAVDGARPNILVFVTDDQRIDGLSVMPKTASWFRAGGTTFPNGVVTTPLCCPSRASIFTGRFAHNHGVRRNEDPVAVRALDQSLTIERYLHDAGYHTAIGGKFLNTWPNTTTPPYFDRSRLGEAYEPGGAYQTDVLGDFAVQSLNAWEPSDATPWFLYLAPKAPHEPYTAQAKYANAPVPAWNGPPSVFEPDRSDKPAWVRAESHTPAEANSIRIAQSRTLMSVDDLVDRVMGRLDALGETNTLAVFLSDNGYFWGEHGVVDTKRLPYLESVEVPFHLRWPGHVAPGAVDPRLVGGIDLAPTFLDAAGLAAPQNHPMDGVSLLSGFRRSRIHLEYYRSTDSQKWPSWAASLTPTSEYVEWYDDDLQTISFREYYDLANDPWQLTNLFGDGNPGNDPNLAPLHAAVAADSVCSGAACLVSAASDTEDPTRPTNLTATDLGAQGVRLNWTASMDNVAVSGYSIERNGNPLGTVGPVTSHVDSTAPATGTLTYHVVAFDGAGNQSDPSDPAQVERTGGPTVLFSDGFEGGSMANWSPVWRVTVQSTIVRTGTHAARATASGQPGFARRSLGRAVGSADLASGVRVLSHNASSAVILLRVVGANGIGLARLLVLPDGRLAYRNDVSGVQRTSTTTMNTAWHRLELRVTGGTSGHVQVRVDGAIVSGLNLAEDLGTAQVGSVEIGDHVSGRSYDVAWDNVSVTTPV